MTGAWSERRMLIGGRLVDATHQSVHENLSPATGEAIGDASTRHTEESRCGVGRETAVAGFEEHLEIMAMAEGP